MVERARPWKLRQFLLAALGIVVLLETVWTINLGPNLPANYRADNWVAVWIGLDVAELMTLLVTMWALWRHRAVVIAAASGAGMLYLVDAWFDVMTARYGDVTQSVLLAVFWEGPWALSLFGIVFWSLRQLRPSTGSATPTSLWSVPLTSGNEVPR